MLMYVYTRTHRERESARAHLIKAKWGMTSTRKRPFSRAYANVCVYTRTHAHRQTAPDEGKMGDGVNAKETNQLGIFRLLGVQDHEVDL